MNVEITDNTQEAIDAKNAAALAVLEAIGLFVESEAKLELEADPRRIDTGNLRNRITHVVPDETEVDIGTNVEYAAYVHEGTRRMEPNRFLKNAVIHNQDQIKTYIENGLKNA